VGHERWVAQYHSRITARRRGTLSTLEAVRLEFLERAADGQEPVIIGVDIVSEGLDLPPLQTLVLARPTFSLRLYMQMIGRGLRGPAIRGTDYTNLIHFGAQTECAKGATPGFVDIRAALGQRSGRMDHLAAVERQLRDDDELSRLVRVATDRQRQ
jgi:hypothetical protein